MLMKTIIYSIVTIALTIPVWVHWGGFHNDIGTLVLALADICIITAIANKHKKSPARG